MSRGRCYLAASNASQRENPEGYQPPTIAKFPPQTNQQNQMTREHAKQILPILTAWANGETVQFNKHFEGWSDIQSADFGSDPSKYRIKPKPREWEIGIHEMTDAFGAKDIACCISVAGERLKTCDVQTKIRVREILD